MYIAISTEFFKNHNEWRWLIDNSIDIIIEYAHESK